MPDDQNDPDIGEKQQEWSREYEEWLEGKLKEYFNDIYSSYAKLLLPHRVRYNDIQMKWFGNPFDGEPVTRYIKWNVSLVGEKLVAKAYRSGDPDSTTYPYYLDDPVYYSEDFPGTSGLTTLSTQSEQDSLDNSCVTTMVKR